jgi:hypothetical protein
MLRLTALDGRDEQVADPAPEARRRRGAARGCSGTAGAVGLTAGASFARCTRCSRICGVMGEAEARDDGWPAALNETCICGALAAELEPIAEDAARKKIPRGDVPAVVLVSDNWLVPTLSALTADALGSRLIAYPQ